MPSGVLKSRISLFKCIYIYFTATLILFECLFCDILILRSFPVKVYEVLAATGKQNNQSYITRNKMLRRVKEIWAYRFMVASLVRRELRGRYKGSFLGFLWTFVNPLAQIIVYTIVFSVIMRSDLDKFYIFAITGMIPWLAFDGAMRLGVTCIKDRGDMINKIYFPREVLPIANVTTNFVNMLFCFVIVFLALFISGHGVNPLSLLFLPIIILIEYILTLGLTFIVSAVTVYFKDMQHILNVIMMMWIYLTPVLYPITIIPDKLAWLFKLNPMTFVIETYHCILYWKGIPSINMLGYSSAAAIVAFLVGALVFYKLEPNFAEEL